MNYKCDTSCRFLFMHDALPFVTNLFSLVYISHAIVIMSFFASSHKHIAPIMSCLVGITTCRCNNITILSSVVILSTLFPTNIYFHTLFYVLPVSDTKHSWVVATVTLDSYQQLSPVPGYIKCQSSGCYFLEIADTFNNVPCSWELPVNFVFTTLLQF